MWPNPHGSPPHDLPPMWPTPMYPHHVTNPCEVFHVVLLCFLFCLAESTLQGWGADQDQEAGVCQMGSGSGHAGEEDEGEGDRGPQAQASIHQGQGTHHSHDKQTQGQQVSGAHCLFFPLSVSLSVWSVSSCWMRHCVFWPWLAMDVWWWEGDMPNTNVMYIKSGIFCSW